MLDTQNSLQNHINNGKVTKFLLQSASSLPKNTPAKFFPSTFGLRFMISSVAPTRSSAFYACLITKIGIRNLNEFMTTGSFAKSIFQKIAIYDNRIFRKSIFQKFAVCTI